VPNCAIEQNSSIKKARTFHIKMHEVQKGSLRIRLNYLHFSPAAQAECSSQIGSMSQTGTALNTALTLNSE
jgi:hypothetical protein